MLRKYFVVAALLVVCLVPVKSFAYPSTVNILERKELVKLTDLALTDAYLDTIIEIEANNILHLSGGFSPREFQEYKALLRYQYELRTELLRRQLDIPSLKHER